MNVRKLLMTAIAAVVMLLSSSHTAYAQSLTLPPVVDLYQHIYPDPYHEPSNSFPRIRIWGWSQNGMVAISEENLDYGNDASGDWSVLFWIFNMVSDSIADRVAGSADFENVGQVNIETEFAAFYENHKNRIREMMRRHNIIEQQVEFSPFPIRRNGFQYNAKLDVTLNSGEYSDGWYRSDYDFFHDTGTRVSAEYRVIIDRSDGRSKTVANRGESSMMSFRVSVGGYFLSPHENRVLIAIVTEHSELGAGRRSEYSFIGAHLGVGFR